MPVGNSNLFRMPAHSHSKSPVYPFCLTQGSHYLLLPSCFLKISLQKLLFSCSVMSDSLWPHRLQHARLSCLSLSPRVCSDSCLSSWWCHPTISSSVTPKPTVVQYHEFWYTNQILGGDLFFSHETFKIMVISAGCLDHNHQKKRSLLLLWFANWLCCL